MNTAKINSKNGLLLPILFLWVCIANNAHAKADPILVKKYAELMHDKTAFSAKNCKLGDEHAKAIAEVLKVNTTLESLDLSNNEINELGGAALARVLKKRNKTLTSLDLSLNQIGTAAATLIKHSNLKSLNIASNNLDYEIVNDILNNLGTNIILEELNLSSNNIFSQKNLSIDSQPEITLVLPKFLRRKKNREVNSHVKKIDACMQSDVALGLSFYDALTTNTKLRKLYLRHNQINDFVESFANAILKRKAPIYLDLCQNKLSDHSARLLLDSLKENLMITELNFDDLDRSRKPKAWHLIDNWLNGITAVLLREQNPLPDEIKKKIKEYWTEASVNAMKTDYSAKPISKALLIEIENTLNKNRNSKSPDLLKFK